jgi:hypothetical protein
VDIKQGAVYTAGMLSVQGVLNDKMLILLGFALTGLFGYSHFIDGDVIQILAKAHVFVTQGTLIPYGNVSSSGASGNIPGAFLTLSSGLPMKLWFSPWSALIFLALLHFLGLLMFQNVMKNFLSPLAMTGLVIVFWLNPWRLSEVFLWNPGYIYFASTLHMWSAFHLSKKPSFFFSILHGLSLFLGLQIHPSFIILFFMTMMLLWTQSLKPHWGGTLSGILIGLLSLTPYFLAGLEDPSIFPQPGSGDGKGFLFFGLVYVYPLLKGFWYWILFGSNIFQTHVFHQLDFTWMQAPRYEKALTVMWTVLKYGIGAFGVGLSFRVNYQFWKAHNTKFNLLKYKMKESQNWPVIYAISAFAAALLATAISPTLPIYWHLLYVWPMALFPLLLKMNEWSKNPETKRQMQNYLLVLVFYFTTTNLLAGLGSKKHDFRKPFHDLYFQVCQETCDIGNLEKPSSGL